MSETTALALQGDPLANLAVIRDPVIVLKEAKKACEALQQIMSQKKRKIVFNDKQYLENEDWITVANMYGVTARIKKTSYVEIGGVKGWEATAEAFLVQTGQVIATADSMCLNDEENWGMRPKYEWVPILDDKGKEIWTKNKDGKPYRKAEKKQVGSVATPLFQLRSMAQTRASSKVLSLCFKWVVVLGGFQPTPAEEMDETVPASEDQQQDVDTHEKKKPGRKSEKAAAPVQEEDEKPRDPELLSAAQERYLWTVSTKSKLSKEDVHDKLKAEYKDKAGNPLLHARDMLKKDFQGYLDSVDPKCEHHTK